ncbi:MAG TPA: VWA domain-containing protein [Thermoanaerobaculia bacterium]|nr:VWA domain-containing protein [Thermoanaerobaculia bacterium]
MRGLTFTLAAWSQALVLATAALADQQIEMPVISERVEVTVINVDVVVNDRQGKPVQGLTANDFEILEDDQPQPISNFSEIKLAPPQSSQSPSTGSTARAAVQPRRRFVFFVDNFSIHPFHRHRVFEGAKEFLRTNLGPSDEAMIVSWNRRLKIAVPPTHDLTHLESGFNEVLKDVSVAPGSGFERDQFLRELSQDRERAATNARMQARMASNDLQQSVRAINTLLSRLAGVDGRKILVLVSEGLPMQPGREFFDAIENDAAGGPGTSSLLEAQEFNSAKLIDSIATAANAAGVTIYAIHPGGPGSLPSAEDSEPGSMRSRDVSTANSIESLTHVSQMTGGLVTSRTNNFASAFARLSADLSSYYSLGYRSTTRHQDRQRNLRVRTKDGTYSVRTRKSFVERSTESQMRERVVANLFFPVSENGMRILAELGRSRGLRKRGEVSVPVKIAVPMDSLTILPSGNQQIAGFSVLLAGVDKNDSVTPLVEKTHRIRFPTSDLPKTKGSHFIYTLDVHTSRGNRLSVAVVDEISKATGFTTLQVPDRLP